jgi:hypothetical protein
MLILINIFGRNVDFMVFLGILLTIIYGAASLITGSIFWVFPRRARLHESDRKPIDDIAQKLNSLAERQKKTD